VKCTNMFSFNYKQYSGFIPKLAPTVLHADPTSCKPSLSGAQHLQLPQPSWRAMLTDNSHMKCLHADTCSTWVEPRLRSVGYRPITPERGRPPYRSWPGAIVAMQGVSAGRSVWG
jgi:hypothetical protein